MKRNTITHNPAEFRPQRPEDLIGKAADLALSILRSASDVKHEDGSHLKALLYGPPGTGKTTIAEMVAKCLVAEKMDIDSINGRNLTIDVVRDWQRNNGYGSLWGGWRVKIINECDLVPMAAQDVMLTYLDELSPRVAVLATSNEGVDTLSPRFKSRFQCIRVPVVPQEEIAWWLGKHFGLKRTAREWIAATCCGNIRQALLDSASFLMCGALPEEVKAAPVKCASRSEAAKRAWETMRARAATAAA